MTELEKLSFIRKDFRLIGDFIDWLRRDQKMDICKFSRERQEYLYQHLNLERFLAEFFKIDLDKVEEEKQKILEDLISHV